MRKLLLLCSAVALLLAAPAAASPTIRMAIVHTVRGCHVWSTTKELGAKTTLTVKRGTVVTIRASCPMDFDLSQTGGPKLALGKPRLQAGTTRTLVFRKAGLYRLVARNVQTPEEVGLQTLGTNDTLILVVRVR